MMFKIKQIQHTITVAFLLSSVCITPSNASQTKVPNIYKTGIGIACSKKFFLLSADKRKVGIAEFFFDKVTYSTLDAFVTTRTIRFGNSTRYSLDRQTLKLMLEINGTIIDKCETKSVEELNELAHQYLKQTLSKNKV